MSVRIIITKYPIKSTCDSHTDLVSLIIYFSSDTDQGVESAHDFSLHYKVFNTLFHLKYTIFEHYLCIIFSH